MPTKSAHAEDQTAPDAALNAPSHAPGKSRAELLAEIAELPPSTFITPAQAAAYLGSTPAVLQSWRSQRRGPRYHGKFEFIRYRISDLDRWMAARSGEIPEIENSALKAGAGA